MVDDFLHLPVMAAEVTELLAAVPPGRVVDATVGGGGHARALLTAR
ncbi:MAG: 16S rRNA (cytosine(1402)-N(4))-methyltransferase, partial [Acidimicrobiia bacterium]